MIQEGASPCVLWEVEIQDAWSKWGMIFDFIKT